ncbi:MAG: replicative DNA helicase [Cytophagales bacterium]
MDRLVRKSRANDIIKEKTDAIKALTHGLAKIPPHAQEVEEAVLGALMIEKHALLNVSEILRPEYFYDDRNVRIYEAIQRLSANSAPIDLITVSNELRNTAELELVGGLPYLVELTNKVNSAANIEFHARIIAEYAMKRSIIAIGTDIEKLAYEDATDVFLLMDQLQRDLFSISEKSIRRNYASMASIMTQALQELEIRKNHVDGLTGVPSGFADLDKLTNGWQKSDLIIVAARPGMGKTAFVVSAARNAAVEFNKGVAIFSLEMASVQLVNRLISAEAEISSEKLKTGKLEDYEWHQLHNRVTKLTNAPIFIDDTPALSLLELRAKCRKLKAQYDIQMVIIDYLQLMSGDKSGGGAQGNREQEISSISRGLKQLAKELSVPVIALSQLSRSVETRGGDKRPQLSDLRESGAIEQDADMVIFLYRPAYYKIEQDETGRDVSNLGEVIIAKHRSGSLDSVWLKFVGQYTKFANNDEFGASTFVSSLASLSIPSGINGLSAFDDAPKDSSQPNKPNNDNGEFKDVPW